MNVHRTFWIGLSWIFTVVTLQAAPKGIVRGSVVNRSGGKTYAGVVVTLEWQANGKTERRQATTDAEGAFVFTGLPVDDTTAMTLSVTVEGKPIRREGVALSTWTPEVVADLEVVEASGDPSKVHVSRLTTILTPSEAPQIVPVIEFWEIHNDGETPFAQTDAKGRVVGFLIPLPEGALNIQIEGEQTPAEIEGTTLVLTQPLPPQATFLSVSYAVPKAKRFSLKRALTFPVGEVLVLTGKGAWSVTSRDFTRGEPVDIHGTSYEAYTRHRLEKGATLEIAFKKGQGTVPSSGGHLWVLLLLVAGGSVIAGGILGSWWVQSKSNRPDAVLASLSREELEAAKEVYLTLIARLDKFHDDGTIPEAVYRRLRDEQKTALGHILARLNA